MLKFPRPRKKILSFLLLIFLLFNSLFFAISCKRKINYFDYVSELRSNILLANEEEFSLRIYAVEKETPYKTDGIPYATSTRMEAYLIAPEGSKTVNFSFLIDERTFEGEMSYDNVKGEYYFSLSLDITGIKELPCKILYGDQEIVMTARSVLQEDVYSPKIALDNVIASSPELFSALTDKYGFAGEIYLRLIYEEAPYYYIGVIDRSGKISAFLLNAKNGKILAKREA